MFGVVTSSVAVLTVGPITAVSVSITNGILHVMFTGAPSQLYLIDRASNVPGPWELGYTNRTSDPSGRFDLYDPVSPLLSGRFYLARDP